MKDALNGIKVLDFSTLLPGPLASLYLVEHGAEVTKIEAPGGEDMRRFPPFLPDGTGACYQLLNRGKTVIELDLKSPDAMAELDPLIRAADVVIEQFRPGVMARLGLDAAALQALNPSLIYCSITGYGQTGPKALKAGHDLNYMAESGILGLTAGADGMPILPPVLAADIAGGSYPAVMQIALALFRRERTGQGAVIDISMTDNLAPFAWWARAIHAATGDIPAAGDWILNGGSPRYGIYPSRDGRAIAVGALEDKFWHALCDAVDLPVPLRNHPTTAQELAARLAGKTAAEWRPILEDADCCASIVEYLSDIGVSEGPSVFAGK